MRIRQLQIKHFRGIEHGVIDFKPHTLLVGDNNVGKSTICEALDLLLGPDRIYRQPVVDEHDFTNGDYLPSDDYVPEIRISAVLADLSDEEKRTIGWQHLRAWDTATKTWIDEQSGGGLQQVDGPDSEMVLPLTFLARYDPEEDDFVGDTFFDHPRQDPPDSSADAKTKMADGRTAFSRRLRRQCGFIYLRALRTGSRALSLQRGSLLDTILRLSPEGSAKMWSETLTTLHDLDPAIGDISQLKTLLNQMRKEVNQYIHLAPNSSATGFFASDLTRENMREVVKLFVASHPSDYPVPFSRQGAGALNMLVFSLLTMIATVKGKESVIFAMEEPEIGLPPHTQRLVTRHVLQEMGQVVVTSHSPYVIEQFDPADIVVLSHDGTEVKGCPVDTGLIRESLYRQAKKEFAEAILSRAVFVVEGAAEVAVFHAASAALESLGAPGYQHLDLAGVSVISAGNDGTVPLFAPIFRAMGKQVYGMWDKPGIPIGPEAQQCIGDFDRRWESSYTGLEKLLETETPVPVLVAFLEEAQTRPSYPTKAGHYTSGMAEDAVRELSYKVLKARKGEGYAALLIRQCRSLADIPVSISEPLLAINADTSIPSVEISDTDEETGASSEDANAPDKEAPPE